jgi:transposase
VLDAFSVWLIYLTPRVLPKKCTGVLYPVLPESMGQIDGISAGWLELDNNRSEHSIKPFVIGRNWLFANSPKGAFASSTIYSIVETAKENGLNPFTYLTYLFEQLPNVNLNDS